MQSPSSCFLSSTLITASNHHKLQSKSQQPWNLHLTIMVLAIFINILKWGTLKWFPQEEKFMCEIQDWETDSFESPFKAERGKLPRCTTKWEIGLLCDFTAGTYQFHLSWNVVLAVVILTFTHELTCCWQRNFINSLIKCCTLINRISGTWAVLW